MDKNKRKLWFRWDQGARNDKKSLKLKQHEGHAGYGMLVQICEILYENDGHADFDFICYDLRCSDNIEETERLKRVLNDYELFTFDLTHQEYSNERVLQEIKEMSQKQKNGSNAAKSRWTKKPHE